MLDIAEIEKAIAELEAGKTTLGTCSKLADLYAIRDNHYGRTHDKRGMMPDYSLADAPTAQRGILENYGDSDFLLVVAGKVPEQAWSVMDDLMDTLRVANPRVYESVMRKMKQL